MKKHLTAIILIIILLIFSVFITINARYSRVSNVITPAKIEIKENREIKTICIQGIETFSLEPDEKFVKRYGKKYKLSPKDIISLGYLAQEHSQKLLLNKRVKVKYIKGRQKSCNPATVRVNGIDYSELLINSGYGIKNKKIRNKKQFKQNLKKARKLNLVILNHHSGKYHTLDCPYGAVAHDRVILPFKQLPKDAKPCKFCHNSEQINNRKIGKRKNENKNNIPQIIPPKLTYTDGNIRMFFTDYTTKQKPDNNCNSTVCKELTGFIEHTYKTLDIAIYGYDNVPAITDALNRAKERGVNIRFVYDQSLPVEKTYYKDNDIITKLASESKSDITNSPTTANMIMHNKFIVSDDSKVFTGSLNLSGSGLSDFDVNNVVIINSTEIAEVYKKEFEQMLNGNFHKSKRSYRDKMKYIAGNNEVEIYFSPQDNAVQRITELINNSENYVYVPTFLLTHRKISDALIDAKRRGIDVRMIIDANGASTSHTKIKELRESGILLKTEIFAGKLHAKSIIIDDKYIITGSMNFSYSGSDKNDENTLIIKNTGLALSYKNFFLYLWTKIPNTYLKRNANPESFESVGSCNDGVDNNFNGKIDSEEESCQKKN